jgi:type I restriction enzyme S subunit
VGRKGTVGAIHYSEQPFWPIDTAYFVERLNDDSWRYLYYLLEYLDLGRLNAATGVPGLSRRDALAIRGAFPPRPEQNEIVRILDAADTIIELTRAAIDKACRVKRGLMQDLLPPWVGFKRLPPESLPRGVEVLPAGHREVARVLNGSTPAREQSAYWRGGTIPWMATGKVNERIIAKADEHVTPKALAECSIELLPRGTVLVAMIGQGKTRGMAASGPSSLFIHKYC